MNRRDFFKRLSTVPIAAAVAVDPLARTIFLPPKGGWPTAHTWRYLYRATTLAPDPTGALRQLLDSAVMAQRQPLTATELRAIVEPELNRIFAEVYAEHRPELVSFYSGQERLDFTYDASRRHH